MSSQFITSDLLKDDPDLIDLIDRFISRLPAMRDAIINAHVSEDWENFVILIHQMKGVGGNYGYHMFTDLCVDIESIVSEKKYTDVKSKVDEFNIICEQIIAGQNENYKIVAVSK